MADKLKVRCCIAGGGPAGMMLGFLLARAGIEVIVGKIRNVELLGFKGKVKWTQDDAGLRVQMPTDKPCEHAITLKIVGA